MTPQRIQLRRTKGWRLPDNTVVVARPTRWGNPFRVVRDGDGFAVKPPGYACMEPATQSRSKEEAARHAVEFYRAWSPSIEHDARIHLAGKNLACWCSLDQPCHGDVLLELANA